MNRRNLYNKIMLEVSKVVKKSINEAFDFDQLLNEPKNMGAKAADAMIDAYKKSKDPEDPTTWQVGDVIITYFQYSARIPYAYKIIRKTPKGFTVHELELKLVGGAYNGDYEELPTDKFKADEKDLNVRINKFGYLKIDGHIGHLWDGESTLHGYSD